MPGPISETAVWAYKWLNLCARACVCVCVCVCGHTQP